jgi:hypothetical protein
MWGSALAIKWGADPKPVTLNDGKGQGNNIAVFPSYVLGICAQLDLWRSSKNYRNRKFADAIAVWSGHNNVESYIRFVMARVPGITRDTVMNDAFWKEPMGIPFLKAQAWHEAGKQYPAPDADWIEAQRRVYSGVPTANTIKKAAVSAASGIASGTAAGTQAGLSLPVALAIGAGVAAVMFIVWKLNKSAAEHDRPAVVGAPAEGVAA